MQFVFWGCVALVVYTYLLYPLLIWIAASLQKISSRPTDRPDADLPSVSVLVVAHNEESLIASRLDNLLPLDYPNDKLQLVVASDGSTDRTNQIVREYAAHQIQLLEFPTRMGKPAVLDSTVCKLNGDIVVLSDANSLMDPQSVRKLVRWFADPRVGVACGEIVLIDPPTGRNVDSLYWRYETFLKRCEGKLGALLGASGPLYAIRRTLFPRIPPGTIVDDFVIPLLARLRSGCRIVYDETAIAYEETPADIATEFQRRARIGAGGFHSLPVLWPLLDPHEGWIAFTFFSHKVLRWLCPFFLVGAAVTNLMLVDTGIYGACFALQLLLYGTAYAGRFHSQRSPIGRAIRLLTMFTAMNAALLVGFVRWTTGRQKSAWQRTARRPQEIN
jgi:cellulose synthase/poly-beta-1,6-N-acetylglucosamine synthase-like glycosyltransferase